MSGQVDELQVDGWMKECLEGLRQERIDGQEKNHLLLIDGLIDHDLIIHVILFYFFD